MRFIILATIFAALAAIATATPWTEICPPLATSKPVCARRVVNSYNDVIEFYLSFVSTCFLQNFNLTYPKNVFVAIAAPGKSCEALGKPAYTINNV